MKQLEFRVVVWSSLVAVTMLPLEFDEDFGTDCDDWFLDSHAPVVFGFHSPLRFGVVGDCGLALNLLLLRCLQHAGDAWFC